MAISIGPRLTDATGGVTSDITGYKVHTFTSNDTFTPTQNGRVEVLIVGGGGGGGAFSASSLGGGGGAGSIVYKKYHSVTASTPYPVTVGSGGNKNPNSGNKTTFTSNNSTYTATGTGTVEVLIVGGGGGAGVHPGYRYGGAGAGSVLYKKFQPVTKDTAYPIIVGAGGNDHYGPGQPEQKYTGESGGHSSAFGITAPGGAGPAEPNNPGASSNPLGSAGGSSPYHPGAANTGIDSIGYGFSGLNRSGGGGGGGAGSTANPNSDSGRPGGEGLIYSISGSSITYGLGGTGKDHDLYSEPYKNIYGHPNGYGHGGSAQPWPSSVPSPGGQSGPYNIRYCRGKQGVVIIRDNSGTPGTDSVFDGITAPGGSGEGRSNPAGSGGSISFRDTSSDGPITLPAPFSGTGGTGANVDKEGYSGGDANTSTGGGGGGGGATGAGQPKPGGGAGGSGYSSSISGTVSTYSHGGPATGVTDATYTPGDYGNGGKGNSNGTGGVVIIRYVS